MFILEKIAEYAKTDRVALINRDERLTFAQMDAYSDAVAAYLLAQFGTEDRTPVVIYGHKQTEMLPCMYGALKAGRAYVPVDITVPADRVRDILDTVKPKLFIDLADICSSGEIPADLYGQRVDTAAVQQIFAEYAGQKPDASHWVQDADPCYILFTSGSTGKPKGVPISKANLDNLYREFSAWVADAKGDVIMNQISYSFDVSVVSVYVGMALGKTLYTIDKGMMENLPELYEKLATSQIAVWVSTPSFAEMCVVSPRLDANLLPQMERFIFCGEVLTHKLTETLFARFPGRAVVNTYGPTEATVLVTAMEVTQAMLEDTRPIPIGIPLNEVRFAIVDEAGNELPEGETGELLIISDSVSAGYFGRPDLTAQRFFEWKGEGCVKRGYRTGDAVYRLGQYYYFCGRIDFQVKLNGYRIELEDIENNMMRVTNVARAVVLPVSKEEKIDHLVAFVMLQSPSQLSALKTGLAIKEELKQYLPSYMIPRKIVLRESFPINTNGKVDRKQLALELK